METTVTPLGRRRRVGARRASAEPLGTKTAIQQLSSPPCVVVLLDGPQLDPAIVGGKGAGLSRLAALGAPVPPAVALTTGAYRRMAENLGIPDRTTLVKTVDLPAIREAIRCWRMPSDVRAALIAAYKGLQATAKASGPLAVRSSATVEDSAASSYAGLHDTILGIHGYDGLERAVKQCWASLWTERAFAYRRQRTGAAEDAAIAVVIQRLIRTDVAFVAFTADPVTGRADRLVIDATWGLGEALVSGMVSPDHVVVDADGAQIDYRVGEKATMVIPVAGGTGTRRVDVPRCIRGVPVLSPAAVQAIAATARSLAAGLGFAADVEGGLADGRLYVFQARPITSTVAHDREAASQRTTDPSDA